MTSGLSFNGLLIVCLIAVAAPILVATVRWLKFPAAVVEILAGIAVGPAGLGWVRVDDVPIKVLALVGLAFLLFLAGLEIDLRALAGRPLRLALEGFVITLVLGFGVGLAFHAVDWVRSPMFLAVALCATSLGLIIPVLKDAGLIATPLGQLTVAGATIADFGGIILLALFFSESEGSTTSRLVTVVGLLLAAVMIGVVLARAGRSPRVDMVLTALQDTSAEIRVRIAVALLIGFVALAASVGLETILGAFLAGAVLGTVDRGSTSHPNLPIKLEAIGFGFVIPIFFIFSGVRFDLDALLATPSAIARVPLFLLALLIARALPALVYKPAVGGRGVVVAGLLQATSLPFLVAATAIGVSIDAITSVNAAALVSAGMLSVVLFPTIAVGIARRGDMATPEVGLDGDAGHTV